MKIVAGTGPMLDARRAAMVVPRAAFRLALSMLPGPEGFEDGLAFADYIGTSGETPRSARILWADATTFARTDPDIAEWAPVLVAAVAPQIGDPDALLDAIFGLAAALDAKDQAAVAAAGAVLAGMLQ